MSKEWSSVASKQLVELFWHCSCELTVKVVFSVFTLRPPPDEEKPALKTNRWAPSQAQLTSSTRPTGSSSGRTLLPLTKRERLSCVISVEDWTYLSITCMEWYGVTSSEVLGHICSNPRPSEDRVLQDPLLRHSIIPFLRVWHIVCQSYWGGIISSSKHPNKFILLSWTWTSTGQPSRWRAPPTCPIHWPPQL